MQHYSRKVLTLTKMYGIIYTTKENKIIRNKLNAKHIAEIVFEISSSRGYRFSFTIGFLTRLLRNRKFLLQKLIYIRMEDWLPVDTFEDQSSEAVTGGWSLTLF